MSSLVELARSAAGEMIGRSRFFQWMMRVSQAADSAQSASAPQYLQAKNNAIQAGVGVNTDILLGTTIASRGISRAGGVSSIEFVLDAGKTYHLIAHGWAQGYSSADGRLQVRWVNGSNVNIPTAGPDAIAAEWRPMTATGTNDSSDPTCECIYPVPSNATLAERTVHLRCTAATGTATIASNGVSATIVEIPG